MVERKKAKRAAVYIFLKRKCITSIDHIACNIGMTKHHTFRFAGSTRSINYRSTIQCIYSFLQIFYLLQISLSYFFKHIFPVSNAGDFIKTHQLLQWRNISLNTFYFFINILTCNEYMLYHSIIKYKFYFCGICGGIDRA